MRAIVMYLGIVFDFDGVLYDSEKHWEDIENTYLRKYIPSWENDHYKNLIGMSLSEVHDYLKKKHGFKRSRTQYFADYDVMANELYSNLAKPLAGIGALVNTLKKMDTKLAIASSSKVEWIKQAMHNHPIQIEFQAIVGANDAVIKAGKPAPDVYIQAAKMLRVDPHKLVAIEDSRNGLIAASTAGMHCIGLRNGFNDEQDLGYADEIFEGYTVKSIARLKELIG